MNSAKKLLSGSVIAAIAVALTFVTVSSPSQAAPSGWTFSGRSMLSPSPWDSGGRDAEARVYDNDNSHDRVLASFQAYGEKLYIFDTLDDGVSVRVRYTSTGGNLYKWSFYAGKNGDSVRDLGDGDLNENGKISIQVCTATKCGAWYGGIT